MSEKTVKANFPESIVTAKLFKKNAENEFHEDLHTEKGLMEKDCWMPKAPAEIF